MSGFENDQRPPTHGLSAMSLGRADEVAETHAAPGVSSSEASSADRAGSRGSPVTANGGVAVQPLRKRLSGERRAAGSAAAAADADGPELVGETLLTSRSFTTTQAVAGGSAASAVHREGPGGRAARSRRREEANSSTMRASFAPRHTTTKVSVAYEVPSLSMLCITFLADHSDSIVDLSNLDETTGVYLLREIMGRQKLTVPLARVFIRSFEGTALGEGLKGLDLYAATPVPLSRDRR